MRPDRGVSLTRLTIRIDNLDETCQPDGDSMWVQGLGYLIVDRDAFDAPEFEVRWVVGQNGRFYTLFAEEPT